ncbi:MULTISPECIES: ABC transporter ATP-binding protein [Rummeliibacillus]|jgi:ABC-2 type transport system ATP-binding protein|uniref:ABC transporter ATP-binding protein n=1 Tax=Rummeliibacillus TaxID=648802 RepID=UPI0011B5A03B|nr:MULTISPECIES: ABC transporter ATP-binding protein [Rummeliibacillus]MBO2534858.1 ABC transporter ATP-binding protein [Rummeliibacillus suwonensis]
MTLVIDQVTKRYQDFTAVDQLSFTIKKGEIFGLIGQNGAGKTTTFRMILDLQETTEGDITWNEQPMNKVNRDILGYLPEERGIFPTMAVEEQLYFFGILRGWTKKDLKKEVDYWIKRFDLEDKRKAKAETLSKGNQQKVQLIASFIHQPEFLILDEPFSGLDPVNRQLLMNAILFLKEKGTTILFSSHQMDNVEELCDHLCVLKKGASLFTGSLLDLKEQYGKIKLSIRSELEESQLNALPGVKRVKKTKDGYTLLLENELYGEQLFQILGKGKYMEKFSMDYLSLDEIFKDLVGGEHV